MLKWCVLVGLDWVEPMMFLLLHVTCSCIFHAYIHLFSIFLIFILLVLFCFSLSLSLFWLVCAWHPSISLLCPEILLVPRHPLLLILPLLMSSSMMTKPIKTFRRTFLGAAFIQNTKSSFRIFPILTYPLSFTVGIRSPFMTSWSAIPPWSYRSFTPICMDLITPYLISSLTFKVRVL